MTNLRVTLAESIPMSSNERDPWPQYTKCSKWFLLEGRKCSRRGLCVEILEQIGQLMNKNVKLFYGHWSMESFRQLGNSTEANENWLHLSDPTSAYTKERMSVADPLYTPLIFENYALAVNFGTLEGEVKVLGVLQPAVWSSCIACVMLISLVAWWISRGQRGVCPRRYSDFWTMSHSFLDTWFTVHFLPRFSHRWETNSLRILATIWAFSALILTRFYKKSFFTAFTPNKKALRPLMNDQMRLAKFIKSRKFTILISDFLFPQDRWLLGSPPIETLVAEEPKRLLKVAGDYRDMMDRMKSLPQTLMVNTGWELEALALANKLPETVFNVPLRSTNLAPIGIYVPRGAVYKADLERTINQMRELGILGFIERRYGLFRWETKLFATLEFHVLMARGFKVIAQFIAVCFGVAISTALSEILCWQCQGLRVGGNTLLLDL